MNDEEKAHERFGGVRIVSTRHASRPGRAKRRNAARLIWSLGLLVAGLAAAGCGLGDEPDDGVFMDTYDTYFRSFSISYNASPNIEDLARRSTVAVEATLVDVEDGRFAGESETEVAIVTLNLVFETDDEVRYYVQLSRPKDSSVDRLRSVLPVGARSVVYLRPNDDPHSDWFNVREDGNEWFFTTPQGWILDHPERGIVFPLETPELRPPFDDSAGGMRDSLADWLVAEKQP